MATLTDLHPAAAVAPTHAPDLGRIALAHDYLNQRGGAERVALELAATWPDAPLYTSLYRPESTFPGFRRADVRPSFLDRLPVDRRFRNLFPLYPAAFRSLGPIDADLLITSTSGWAHGIRVRPGGRHLVYCHNPARWLYGEQYLGASSAKQRAIRPLLGPLRGWDAAAARRADLYVANSHSTRERIRRVYGIDALVVPPPVDVACFRATPRGERLLVVSRLLPYKRVDVVVDAATQAGIALDVVGTGPELAALQERAGPTVTFHGRVEDAVVLELMQSCRALCVPGVEDFGITPVEAQAAGKPVIAFAGGGSLETVDRWSGVFFERHDPDAFLAALRRCDRLDADHELIALRARRFSRAAFRWRMTTVLTRLAEGAAASAEDVYDPGPGLRPAEPLLPTTLDREDAP
jgi:glycosyltransferase involved in cell wall biosynthesis